MDLIRSAQTFLNSGLSILPITETKQPAITSWRNYQTQLATIDDLTYSLGNAFGIAVIGGNVSGQVEVIDIDSKYDLTGTMLGDYCQMIKDNAPEILPKLTVAKTMNGGYHFIYKLPIGVVEGNKKLASRPATTSEAEQGDKVKVLFETRGEGGYFAVAPTPGYEIARGDIFNLQTITQKERDLLFALARSFDSMPAIPEPQEVKIKARSTNGDISPFDDYNDRAEIPSLLIRHGWKQVYQGGNRIHFKRPGNTDSPIAANYDTRRRIFYVFSTSTVFDSEKGYNPTQVFTILEHNGDYSAASRDLFTQGFGKRKSKVQIKYVKRKKQSSGLYKWMKKYEEHKKGATNE